MPVSQSLVTAAEEAPVGPMPAKGDLNLSELHEMIRGGERVLIRRARSEDTALYPDFFRDVSADDLRLRFLGVLPSSAPRRSISSAISTTGTKWLLSRSTKTR